jgi:hypothetical protein
MRYITENPPMSKALPLLACAAVFLSQHALAGPFLEPDVEVIHTLTPDQPGGSFGFVGANVGDITNDGVSDFVIGAALDQGSALFGGRGYVYSGGDGTLINVVDGRFLEFMGSAAAGLGDVSGDGVPDYALGAPGLPPAFGANPGRVVVLSGADHSVLHETFGVAGARYGFDLNRVDDVDGDGFPEMAVGAPFDDRGGMDAGRVHLLSGVDGTEIWFTDGLAPGDSLGGSVAGLPDLDGDGTPDVVAGAFSAGPTDGGEALLLSGATGAPGHSFTPLPAAMRFGQFFAEDAGDVDGDGTHDIYVGDFLDGELGFRTGRAYLFSGATFAPLRVLDGEHGGDGFGIGRGAGDINADGRADQVLAAFTNSDGAPGAGKAYLFSGRDGGVIRTYTATNANEQIGFDALGIDDVNNDGIGDYLLTGNDIAYVVAGTDSSVAGRIDSLCQLIASIPDDAFKAPSDSRKQTLCNKLIASAGLIASGDGVEAATKLTDDVFARMDGSLGGNPGNDWITDPFWQEFLSIWVDGLVRLASHP